jgi:hypothetical protein
MLEIILKLIDNWRWLIILFFCMQLIKIVGNFYLKSVEIKTSNKDQIRFAQKGGETVIEVTSSNIKLSDIERLKNTNALEFKPKL